MPLDPSQAAKILELSTNEIRHLLRSGKLKGTKDPQGKWSIQYSDLESFIARRSFTVAKWAERHGLHPETVREMLRKNKLPGYKDGRWIWIVSDVPEK